MARASRASAKRHVNARMDDVGLVLDAADQPDLLVVRHSQKKRSQRNEECGAMEVGIEQDLIGRQRACEIGVGEVQIALGGLPNRVG